MRGKLASRKLLLIFFPKGSPLESRTDWLLHLINSSKFLVRETESSNCFKGLTFGLVSRTAGGDPCIAYVVIVRPIFCLPFLHFLVFSKMSAMSSSYMENRGGEEKSLQNSKNKNKNKTAKT